MELKVTVAGGSPWRTNSHYLFKNNSCFESLVPSAERRDYSSLVAPPTRRIAAKYLDRFSPTIQSEGGQFDEPPIAADPFHLHGGHGGAGLEFGLTGQFG